ncbi:MAG: hypothetical protein RMJ59_02660 [Candidatus Nitrosocaldus sp.]|nr:hypothetical protein [Candidatus Nitrosocaldus sp.]MCS7140570.1 hypothetical protein [Candidatus Nitrosocaldus sp.]MDW7999616.1 hypothetical protein [Candidatus Nitrosocaldus sp.]MDW8275270.1 hypothetical protein [Candidatus Nitrosocaldus sp.]
MKGIFIAWGSAPALAVATILMINMLSAGMHTERGEEVAGVDEGGDGEGKSTGYTGEERQGEEQGHAQEKGAGDVAGGIASAPESAGERRMLAEPSTQMAPVMKAEPWEEQYIRLALPYVASVVAASLSFIIVRRLARQG